MTKLSAQ